MHSADRAIPFFGDQPTSIVRTQASLSDGDLATAQTVERMQAWSLARTSHPAVWQAARAALGGVAGSDRAAIAASVFRWIQSHIRFEQDDQILRTVLGVEDELELLIEPARLLTMPSPMGDCDDFTMLCCSMLLALGVPCEVVTIAADPYEPKRFSHVYSRAILERGDRLALDCSHGAAPGWEAPEFYRQKVWPVLNPPASTSRLHGLVQRGMGAPIDWGKILEGSIKSGFDIVKQVTIPKGAYVQTAGGVLSREVPYATPGQYPGTGVNVGLPAGLGTGTLLVIGAIGIGLVLVMGRRR